MIIRQQTAIYVEQQQVLQNAIKETISKIELNEHNKQTYTAMLDDMLDRKNGVFSFVVRVSDGNIVDYVLMESIAP